MAGKSKVTASRNVTPWKSSRRLKPSYLKAIDLYMEGKTRKEALLAAGFSDTTASRNPGLIFNRDDVQAEIDRRRHRMRNRNAHMMAKIEDELAKIAFFNIGDVLEVTEDGELIFSFDEADMDHMAAIGEVTVETYKEGKGPDAEEVKRVKVKPYDKKAALDSLSRIYGMFQDRLNVTNESDLEERLAQGRRRVQKTEEVVDAEYEELD